MTSKKKLRARISRLRAELSEFKESALNDMLSHPPFVGVKYIDVPEGVRRVAIPYMVYPPTAIHREDEQS